MDFETLANATLQIECGDSTGSGFHFIEEDIIVTNAHVVEGAIDGSDSIKAHTESGESKRVRLEEYSLPPNAGGFDVAVGKLNGSFSESRTVLEPSQDDLHRGADLTYAGFPHGIDDLLVMSAKISGPYDHDMVPHDLESLGFYIDNSVNGGNSGGPIIHSDTGDVVGIVSASRFLGQSYMNKVKQEMRRINLNYGGSMFDMVRKEGNKTMSMNETIENVTEAVGKMNDIIEANSNTGIGIFYRIDRAVELVDMVN